MSTKAKEVPDMLTMPPHPRQRLEQALKNYRQDLEGLQSALLRFEEALLELEGGALNEDASQHQNDQNISLLSPQEVCLKLGADRSWVYEKLRSGEIPSLTLGGATKVRQRDLEEYTNGQRCHPRSLSEENSYAET